MKKGIATLRNVCYYTGEGGDIIGKDVRELYAGINKYNAERYDRVTINLPKGYKKILRRIAVEQDLSVSALVNKWLMAELGEKEETENE